MMMASQDGTKSWKTYDNVLINLSLLDHNIFSGRKDINPNARKKLEMLVTHVTKCLSPWCANFSTSHRGSRVKKKCESMERQLIDTKCKDSSVFEKWKTW